MTATERTEHPAINNNTSSKAPLRILTAYEKARHPAWLARVEIFQELADDSKKQKGKRLPALTRLLRELFWTLKLLHIGRQYDIVLTGSDRIGLFFAASQRFLRRNRVRHIFIDFLVTLYPDHSMRFVRKLLYSSAVRGASRVIVQRSCEVELYARAFGVPVDRFEFVLYHATLYDAPRSVRDEGYIFAGGDGHRDYPLLIEAVRDLPYRVVIAALEKSHFKAIAIPPNIEIRSTTSSEFIQLMAGAHLVVVPLLAMPQHVGGEQTYANAMTLGKPTIVTDLGASDYIRHNVDGILTSPGEVASLRAAIQTLMQNEDLARTMGIRAKEASAKFRPERFFQDVFRICEQTQSEASRKVERRSF